jgi:hypothetical protein
MQYTLRSRCRSSKKSGRSRRLQMQSADLWGSTRTQSIVSQHLWHMQRQCCLPRWHVAYVSANIEGLRNFSNLLMQVCSTLCQNPIVIIEVDIHQRRSIISFPSNLLDTAICISPCEGLRTYSSISRVPKQTLQVLSATRALGRLLSLEVRHHPLQRRPDVALLELRQVIVVG